MSIQEPESIIQSPPHPTAHQIVQEEDGIDIWGYVGIIRRRWLLILLATLVTAGITAFITLRMTKIYRATTTLRIETQAPQVLGRAVEAVDEMGTGSFWSNVEYYETQYKIIASRDIVSRVVKEFKLHEDMEFLGITPEKQKELDGPISVAYAAQVLQSMMTVEPVKDSRLVNIHVDSADPHRAQLYANAIAKAYVDKNLESMLETTIDAVSWLSEQLDSANQKLSSAEDAIREYKKTNGILTISLEDRQNILTAQMTAAATNLTQAKADRIAIQARKNSIAQLMNIEDPMAIPLDAINTNSLIQQLKQSYGTLRQQYDELSERYGDNFPAMVELKAKLNRIKNDVGREVTNILRAVDAELSAALATEAGLKKTLDELRNQALELSQKEFAYSRLVRQKDNQEKTYHLLHGRNMEADLSRLLKVNNVHILDPALLPELPIKPRLKLNLALAMVIGLLMGLGMALLVEFADRTVKTQEDIEDLKIAFLGIVPSIDSSSANPGSYNYVAQTGKRSRIKKKKEKVVPKGEDATTPINYDTFVHDNPKSQVAESCRSIRTNLLFMSADHPAKRILVTSPSPQEGKTTFAVNLAIVMAQSGSKVLLVDTDMRRPRIHKSFDIRPRTGISTLTLGESTREESVIRTRIPNLDILTCGPIPPNPSELIHTDRFAAVVDELSNHYDRVIFDSPPVAVVTDAAILSKMVDGTVLIIKSLQTTKDSAKHAVGVLSDIGANILGAVLNDLDLTNRKYGQHYYYYYYKKYGYYYQSDEDTERSSLPNDQGENHTSATT